MYDELVKALRGPYDSRNDILLMKQAAYAIEELSRDLDSMNEANIALYGALPRWISVKERLPKAGQRVLLLVEKICYTGFLYPDGRFHVFGAAYPQKPTHWAQLPEPPKEEN